MRISIRACGWRKARRCGADIIAGKAWKGDIADDHVILMLHLAFFNASKFIRETELPAIRNRRATGECLVVPILARPSRLRGGHGVPVAAEPKFRISASERCRPSVGPQSSPSGPWRMTVLPSVVIFCRWLWRWQGCSVQNGRHPGANGFIVKPNGHQRHLHDQPEAVGQTPRKDLMIARRQ